MAELFGHGPRTDRTTRSFSEPLCAFMDRSGDPFFAEVRHLMTGWLGHVPSAHVADVRRRLQSKDDAQFESAFWELYLHEAYLRSGYRLTIHPVLSGTRHRPDFLIEGDGTRFYLEAVGAGAPAGRTSENRRLEEARRILAEVGAERYMLDMATYAVGTRPLPVKVLKSDLREWLSAPDTQGDHRRAAADGGALARRSWSQDGWRLEFTAQPIRSEQAGAGLPLVRSHLRMGWSHDASRILAALNGKANRYGALEAPLVIAVLSNSEFHTEDLDVERALFGALTGRPCPEPPGPGQILEPGHWCTSKGWRRAHIPQVIAIQDLYPWTVTKARPRLWTTLESGTCTPAQPGWLAHVQVSGAAPTLGPADSLADLFGIPADWPSEEPHFVARPHTTTL